MKNDNTIQKKLEALEFIKQVANTYQESNSIPEKLAMIQRLKDFENAYDH